MNAPDVAVIVPTLRRPDSLERALRSLFVQTDVSDRLREIVVVDNDPAASSRDTVDRLRPASPVLLIWRHAPRPGVATARNEGLAATEAPLIAFLDDDEAASPGWLAALLAGQKATGADAVFGPIRGRVPDGTGWTTPYLECFFGREGPDGEALARQWIDRAVSENAWLILYTHDVREAPSPWGCTPDALSRLIAHARATGCDIRTVGEVLAA